MEWIKCSDEMPISGKPVITSSSSGVVQNTFYFFDEDENGWMDWHEEYDKLSIDSFSHWMYKPESPNSTNC